MPYTISVSTYGDIIQQIARMVGHPIPADPAGSTDSAVLQMGAAVNNGLLELLTMYDWQDLTIKTSLSVVAGTPGEQETAFDLPDDFYKFIDQSQWDSSSQLPAAGPISNQSWMAYTVRNVGTLMQLTWQLRGDQLIFMNAPDSAVDFDYMYLSRGQVIDADDATLYKDQADKNGDTFVLDTNLITLLGRAKYLEWKGFDSEAATRDFIIAYNSRVGVNTGSAPVLNVGRRPGVPLINGYTSVPDTGYGS